MDSGRFRVILEPVAEKIFGKLERKVQTRIRIAFKLLSSNPTPPKARKLVGRAGYRIRVGDYRVLYDIKDDEVLVLVFRIEHRSKAYRG